jgi:predicted Co/Zn/Cd cation transporter (cation efflux family)
MLVSVGFAVVALAWGLAANSQVILLDAVYTPLGLVFTLVAMRISRLAAAQPSRRYPFGRDALIPLFVVVQGVFLLGMLAYAGLEATRVILAGGSDVSTASLLAYGLASAAVCVLVWLRLRRTADGLPLVEAEAAGWMSAAGSSLVIGIGGGAAWLLRGTALDVVEPYTDSVLVLLSCVLLLPVPVRLVVGAVRGLQDAAPPEDVGADVRRVVERVRVAAGLPPPVVRVGQIANVVDVSVVAVLPEGVGDVALADRVRRSLRDGLDELAFSTWLVLEVTHDLGLVDGGLFVPGSRGPGSGTGQPSPSEPSGPEG